MTIALVVAFIGWVVTAAGWYVSQRSQRRNFLNQVLNTARRDYRGAP